MSPCDVTQKLLCWTDSVTLTTQDSPMRPSHVNKYTANVVGEHQEGHIQTWMRVNQPSCLITSELIHCTKKVPLDLIYTPQWIKSFTFNRPLVLRFYIKIKNLWSGDLDLHEECPGFVFVVCSYSE